MAGRDPVGGACVPASLLNCASRIPSACDWPGHSLPILGIPPVSWGPGFSAHLLSLHLRFLCVPSPPAPFFRAVCHPSVTLSCPHGSWLSGYLSTSPDPLSPTTVSLSPIFSAHCLQGPPSAPHLSLSLSDLVVSKSSPTLFQPGSQSFVCLLLCLFFLSVPLCVHLSLCPYLCLCLCSHLGLSLCLPFSGFWDCCTWSLGWPNLRVHQGATGTGFSGGEAEEHPHPPSWPSGLPAQLLFLSVPAGQLPPPSDPGVQASQRPPPSDEECRPPTSSLLSPRTQPLSLLEPRGPVLQPHAPSARQTDLLWGINRYFSLENGEALTRSAVTTACC